MIRVEAVPLGRSPPDEINIVVTHPAGTAPMAVTPDPTCGALAVDRLYQTAMHCPGTLGLLPQTRLESGSPLTAFLPIEDAIPAGFVMACRPVGVVSVTGVDADTETVLAVPVSRVAARFDRVKTYTDIGAPLLRRFAHFLTHCQDLEDDQVPRSAAWGDVNEARRVITEAAQRARPGVAADG